eukprot:9741380-Ditylum_brightwellii.AAC.1
MLDTLPSSNKLQFCFQHSSLLQLDASSFDMRGRGRFVVLGINDGGKEQSLPPEEVLFVVLVVVKEVERWCHRWCVCCRHLILLLRPPDFGIYGQVAGL